MAGKLVVLHCYVPGPKTPAATAVRHLRRVLKKLKRSPQVTDFIRDGRLGRSEERRVGKEWRARWETDQAEDGIRDPLVTGVQTCALPIWAASRPTACTASAKWRASSSFSIVTCPGRRPRPRPR